MTEKPLWLTTAVDVAEIVSAIATATTVAISLYISQRAERQRPKLIFGLHEDITIGPDEEAYSNKLSLCSFAGRIDPRGLTLPPGSRERRDPVVRPLESQFFQVLMDLFQRAPLLA